MNLLKKIFWYKEVSRKNLFFSIIKYIFLFLFFLSILYICFFLQTLFSPSLYKSTSNELILNAFLGWIPFLFKVNNFISENVYYLFFKKIIIYSFWGSLIVLIRNRLYTIFWKVVFVKIICFLLLFLLFLDLVFFNYDNYILKITDITIYYRYFGRLFFFLLSTSFFIWLIFDKNIVLYLSKFFYISDIKNLDSWQFLQILKNIILLKNFDKGILTAKEFFKIIFITSILVFSGFGILWVAIFYCWDCLIPSSFELEYFSLTIQHIFASLLISVFIFLFSILSIIFIFSAIFLNNYLILKMYFPYFKNIKKYYIWVLFFSFLLTFFANKHFFEFLLYFLLMIFCIWSIFVFGVIFLKIYEKFFLKNNK